MCVWSSVYETTNVNVAVTKLSATFQDAVSKQFPVATTESPNPLSGSLIPYGSTS
jgi:hypothetical protein